MRISQKYSLNRSQATLDFVDVDISLDTPVFISPQTLTRIPSDWAEESVFLIQSFFQTVLTLIREGENEKAENLLRELREPNETHLGLSKGKSRGHALGELSAHDVWAALSRSEAAKSGLLKDLEDTILMIEGISVDIVSDMATNIIRAPLIRYTQGMCHQYGIPMTEGVATGPLWDATRKAWAQEFSDLPVADGEKLLLVPKAIVRRHMEYDADEYYRHFLLVHMQASELAAGTGLVRLLKDGTPKVTKKSLIEKYGGDKKAIVRESLRHPEALALYKQSKEKEPNRPLSHEEIADAENNTQPDWDNLLLAVTNLATGADSASAYEKNIEALLTALFYPSLSHPIYQHKIHGGRKRIDIAYTNMGGLGFFEWLAKHYSAAHVFVECKNYSQDPANPELDQLAGRFSPSRGQFGLLVCRSFDNKKLFNDRCRDTAKDGHGFIVALDDSDLTELVESRKTDPLFLEISKLRTAFQFLVS